MASSLSSPDSYFQTISNRGEPLSVDAGSVELIELHDEPACTSVIPSLLSVYQERGFEQGYQQAVTDIVTNLFGVTEDFVRAQSTGEARVESPGELRRLLYQFGQQLERRLQTLSPDLGYMSGGLGI